jgi:ADP-ribosylglycohydrolase
MQSFCSERYRARCGILGAIVGDALGASLEFEKRANAKILISRYFYFQNGLVGMGPFNLSPGQFTGNTEMALAIMYVIHQVGRYDHNMVSEMYHKWYLSNPLDIGNTISLSVSQKSLENMLAVADIYNRKSLSNRFLMRLFCLICMYYDKPFDFLTDAIKMDVSLTHSHPEAQKIATVYAMMLWQAIHGENAEEIYHKGRELCVSSELLMSIYEAVDLHQDVFLYQNTKYFLSDVDTHLARFVGFALWLLLRTIKYHSSYSEAILEVVSFGGDTDTNACIVGAIMGALYPTTIPEVWINSVLNCKAVERYKKYPIADPQIWYKWLP